MWKIWLSIFCSITGVTLFTFKLLLIMMNYYNGHIMETGAKQTIPNPLRVIYILLLHCKISCLFSCCWLCTLNWRRSLGCHTSYSVCVTEACRACKAGSTSSSQAEETNRIIYRCKIFIWELSVAPLLKYNIGYSAEKTQSGLKH